MKNKHISRVFSLVIIVASFMLTSSCKKEVIQIPVLTTSAVSAITSSSAASGGNITSSGGAAITARGVCWSTNQNPTTSDSKTSDEQVQAFLPAPSLVCLLEPLITQGPMPQTVPVQIWQSGYNNSSCNTSFNFNNCCIGNYRNICKYRWKYNQ